MHYGTFDAAELLKSTSGQMKMADGRQTFIRCNSATDCSILLTFGSWYRVWSCHSRYKCSKVKESKVEVTL